MVAPAYQRGEPPPGVIRDRYDRQLGVVGHLTEHFHEAPVWIVACYEGADTPRRGTGAHIYPAVRNTLLPPGLWDWVPR